MSELIYRLYGFVHRSAKNILGHATLGAGEISFFNPLSLGISFEESSLWRAFINGSKIKDGDFSGGLFAGYIAEKGVWCLPSWIWTNAATIRSFCKSDNIEEVLTLGEHILERQEDCGGWIVRNDYDKLGAIPMLAPNDSAYIANNACISLYLATQDDRYLIAAKRCADWIIETARPDGMVFVGYNMRDRRWDKNCVIVDVGFTGGLFSALYEITKEEQYKSFLKKFIARYIELFYIPSRHGFCTSIDKNDRQQGGMFGRGQAWALEGLIPAYKVLKDDQVKEVILSTINNLIRVQCKDGGWSYNLAKPLMGEDCKAVSVIAKDMMDWNEIMPDARIQMSAEKALNWCKKHTAKFGEAKGGIFSFCIEGAIVKDLYTSCAFVYASAYAIELEQMLVNE